MVLAVFTAWFFALTTCERKPSPTTRPAQGQLRLVSLSPAISRTLVDLDLAQCIVGRTPFCSSIDQTIPVVGDLLSVDYEQIIRLNPTHILLQPPAAGVDLHLARLAESEGWRIGAWRLNGINDIRSLVGGLAETICAFEQYERCDTLRHTASRIDDQIGARIAVDGATPCFSGRVLMVSSVNPALAYGTATYLNDILNALGGTNAISDQGWVQLSLEDIVHIAPDAIIRVLPGGEASHLVQELGPLASIEVPAVKTNRLAMLIHIDAELPSTGVIGVAAEMRAILHRFAENASPSDNRS